MATTALEEEKKKAAIAAQDGKVIPNAAPLQSQGMAVLKASTPAAAPEKPAPSLNAPWYSREYATAANMSDKGGLELERDRAAGGVDIPQDDPARRLITTGTVSTGQPQPISSNEGRNAPAPAQKPSGLSVVAAPARQAAPQQSAQQPVGQQSMQPTAPQQTPNTVNGRDVGLTSPDNGFRAYPAERGFNFDKFQPQSGEGAFRNEQTGQVTRLSSPGVAAQPVQQARGVRIIMDEPQQLQQVQPARQPVVMPQLNTGGGVFASMANFANQASQAYAQGVQNKAIRKEAERENARQEGLRNSQIAAGRLGLDSFRAQTDAQQGAARLQDEASTNALRRKAVQADLDTKAQLDAARQEYLAAGDDPAKQKAAARKLQVLSGKDGQKEGGTWDSIVVGGGVNEQGMKVGGTAMLYNKSTGEVRPIGEQQAQAKTATTGQKYAVGQTVVKPDGSRGRVVAIDANGMATEIQPL